MTNFVPVNVLPVNNARKTSTATNYQAFLADEKRASVFFMQLAVRDRTDANQIFTPPAPINALPVNVTRNSGTYRPSSEVKIFSSRNWIGRPDDPIKPNTAPLRRLIAAFRIKRTTPYWPTEDNRIQTTVANATLDNSRRDLDYLGYSKSIEATVAPIHHGPLDGPFSDAQLIARPLVFGVETQGDELRVDFTTQASLFSNVDLQTAYYSGAGGLGGDVGLTGTLKPFVVGTVFNMLPVLILSDYLIYQVHSGRVSGIGPVWEGGLEIPFDADYETLDALAAADIPSGYYATCKTYGLFRLSQSPTKKITCSVRGDATAGSYVQDSGAILIRVITQIAKTPTSLLSLSSFSKLSKQPIGWYNERKEYTVEQFINAILAPENGVLGQSRTGLISIIKHRPLDETTAPRSFRIRPTQIRIRELQTPPIKKEKLYYGWNWSPFTSEDDFAEAVPESERVRFRAQALTISATSGQISALRKDAVEIEKITWFAEESETAAQQQANADMEIYGRSRVGYEIEFGRKGFGIKDGEVIEIVCDRFGFENGKKVVAVDFDESAKGETVTVGVIS